MPPIIAAATFTAAAVASTATSAFAATTLEATTLATVVAVGATKRSTAAGPFSRTDCC